MFVNKNADQSISYEASEQEGTFSSVILPKCEGTLPADERRAPVFSSGQTSGLAEEYWAPLSTSHHCPEGKKRKWGFAQLAGLRALCCGRSSPVS